MTIILFKKSMKRCKLSNMKLPVTNCCRLVRTSNFFKILLMLISILLIGIIFLMAYVINKSNSYFALCRANSKAMTFPEARLHLENRDTEKEAFFFIESSCTGNIDARQICSIESSAKLHPQADIYLLLVSPPSTFKSTSMLQHIQQMYKNIQVLYVNLDTYFKNTILENWYASEILTWSFFPIVHVSDVLRIITLWRYGGTYLDLDAILIKSIQGFNKFAGAESINSIANGVINLGEPHSYVSTETLIQIRDTYCWYSWNHNGPSTITRVLTRLCKTYNTYDMIEKCKEFNVLPTNAMYPFLWYEWDVYFTELNYKETMNKISNSLSVHMFSHLSYKEKVFVNTNQPYNLIAQEYCPVLYSNVVHEF